MITFTAFCQQSNGRGTIWIQTVEAEFLEQAIEVARQECADSWGCDVEEVHCLGLADGDVSIAYWDDLYD